MRSSADCNRYASKPLDESENFLGFSPIPLRSFPEVLEIHINFWIRTFLRRLTRRGGKVLESEFSGANEASRRQRPAPAALDVGKS